MLDTKCLIFDFSKLQGFSPAGRTIGQNVEALLGATPLKVEQDIDIYMEAFEINGVRTIVGENKFKWALFIAYLSFLLSKSKAAHQKGEVFTLNDRGRRLVRDLFSDEVVNNPEKHPVPAALLKHGAKVRIIWKQAD